MTAGRDEAAAEVLSIGYFTTLQVLFAIVLYLPAFLAILGVADLVDVGTFLATARLSTFMIAGLLAFLLGLVTPFAALLWVMLLKLVLGGDIYKNNVRPGVYPKWSRMHLRVWRIGRMERTVLRALVAMYRSAPLTSFVLRQLGATVGHNLQCAQDASLFGPLDLISIEDDVSVSTGAYIHTTRWSGQSLQVGPIRLESGCKIGMRAAVANNVTVGRGTWITPFTPILADVGPHEMWEGAPARLAGRCTELKRTASACRYAQPIWLLEILSVLMQGFLNFWLSVAPTIAISMGRPCDSCFLEGLFSTADISALRPCSKSSAPGPVRVRHHLGQPRRDLNAGLPLHPLHGWRTGAVPVTRAPGRAPHVQDESDERHPATVDLDHHRAVPASARRCALPARWGLGMRPHGQSRPGARQRRLSSVLVPSGLHEHARLRRRALEAAAARVAQGFLVRQQLRGGVREVPRQLSSGGLSRPATSVQPTNALAARRANHGGGKPAGEICERLLEAEDETLPGFPLFLTRAC